jgi:hypothetical protein
MGTVILFLLCGPTFFSDTCPQYVAISTQQKRGEKNIYSFSQAVPPATMSLGENTRHVAVSPTKEIVEKSRPVKYAQGILDFPTGFT